MSLRIRKEVQDRLKASLDGGTPEAAPASEPAAETALLQAQPPLSASPAHQGRAAPRGCRSDAGWRHRLREGGRAHRLAAAAVEIEAIRSMFDSLVAEAEDPHRLLALRSLTERYLWSDPSPQKIDQVRGLLLRHAAAMRRERAAREAPARPLIDAFPAIAAVSIVKPAIAGPSAARAEPAPTRAAEDDVQPDRLRRGEPETPSAAAQGLAAQGLATPGIATPGIATPGKEGEAGRPIDPSVQRHPIRARVKTALMASVWAAAGLGVCAYAGSLVYVNYLRLEIDTALISGSVEPVNAPFDGSVASLLVKAGDRLSEGMRYLVLEDPEVEKQVKLFGVKVDRAREDLRLKQAEYEAEKAKRDEYIGISRNKMDKILSEIEALEKQAKVARERFERMSDLFKKGIVIRPRLEEASDKLAELTAQLAKAHVNKKEREHLFDGVLAGHYYDGSQLVGRLREAEAAVIRASAEVDLALEELQALQQRRHGNRIAAQHDARVLKVLRQEGSAVKRGDTMLVVERLDERVVHAFVRQEEIGRIAIGDEATVYIPAMRARATAKVVGVERNAAFLDDIDARYSWKTARDGGPKPTDKDRTARVTLKFDQADREIVDGKLEIGMPTVVSFQRRSVNTVFSDFGEVGRRM